MTNLYTILSIQYTIYCILSAARMLHYYLYKGDYMKLIVEKYYKGKQYATVTAEVYSIEDLAFRLHQCGISENMAELVNALEQDTVVYKLQTTENEVTH